MEKDLLALDDRVRATHAKVQEDAKAIAAVLAKAKRSGLHMDDLESQYKDLLDSLGEDSGHVDESANAELAAEKRRNPGNSREGKLWLCLPKTLWAWYPETQPTR